MFESVSIGDLAAAALGTGSDAVKRGLAGEDVKNAFVALKNHADLMAAKEVASLELLPHSVARRGVVGHILDGNSEDYDSRLHVLAKSLIYYLKMESPVNGVDLSYLLLLDTHFDKPKAKEQAPTKAKRLPFINKSKDKVKKATAGNSAPARAASENSSSQSL